ncbi:Transposable element P transposase [Lucilia cuprina]|nr:Transposable element P transposase [Lucilia cuprina]
MKCAVGKCKQSNSKKTCEKFCILLQFSEGCNTKKGLGKILKICALHFKPEDFERNLKFELGFSNRRTQKLKPGVVPTIESCDIPIEIPNETPNETPDEIPIETMNENSNGNVNKISNENVNQNTNEIEPWNKKSTPMMTTYIKADELQQYIKSLEMEIDVLRKENGVIKILQSQSEITIKNLTRQVQSLCSENVNLEDSLKRLFTKGQIKKLKNGDKRQNFTEADIAQSIKLYSASAKATLQRWSEKLDMSTGILDPVVKILSAANQMPETEKLSFDEMKTKKNFLLAPANNIQVALLRGLIANWKQPIYYDYGCQMSKSILIDILKTMKQCGFTIVAIVCDLGGGNRKLFNELGVDFNKPWFLYDDTKIFVFNDVPHLIKLLRNHFIDSGFIINNKEVKKDVILNLLSLQFNDLKITHKISAHNLNVVGVERQKVKLATKLFSHTVAQSITRAASLGHLQDQNWSECTPSICVTISCFPHNKRWTKAVANAECGANSSISNFRTRSYSEGYLVWEQGQMRSDLYEIWQGHQGLMPSDINMETDECLFLSRPSPSWTSNVDPSVPSAVLTESFPTEYTKTYVNQETQTDPDIFAAESAKYVDKIRELERENKELNFRLKMQVHNSNMALHGVNKIFTEGQIRNAICLHAAGPRAYNHLYKKGFPLAHVSTLQRWCQKVDVHEGLLKTSLGFMQQATDLSQDEKICVLAFDEMKIAETFEYDCTNDVVRQPAKYVQVIMARGLKKSWKQPVFYDFDCRMSKQILDSIISELSKAGFPVLAIVCDMGPTNRKLWSDLGATTGKYY